MTDFEQVMARLSPKTREKIRIASEIEDRRLELPSIGLTRALSGGIKYGGQTMLWGNRSGTKTATALGAMAKAQEKGESVAFIDAEKSYNPKFAEKLGLDSSRVITSPVSSIDHCTDTCIDLMRSGVDVIAIDSISALLPGSFFAEGELKGLSATGQIGQFSRDIGRMLGMFNYINERTALIVISQIRTDLGGFHASLKPMGGKAVDHYNTSSIKLWSSTAAADQIQGEVCEGDLIFKQPVARPVKWFIDKERGPGMGTDGSYDFYYAGDNIGIDRLGEVLDYAVLYGKVVKSGKWHTIYDEQFDGRKAALKYLKANPEIADKLSQEVLDV